MKNILILIGVLIILGAGYYVATLPNKMSDTDQAVTYTSEPVLFLGENGQFTVQYSGDNEAARLAFSGVQHDLMRMRSASGARYVNTDESVVFWEQGGVAMVQVNGVVVIDDATIVQSTDSHTLTFSIAPEKVDCVGVGPMECLVVNGEYFYDSIAGFEFEPGYQQVILVERTIRENVPADASSYQYSLIEVISKTPAPTAILILEDTMWKWQQTFGTDGEVTTPLQSDAFSLTFQESDRVSITTDCNNGTGTYTSGGSAFSFGPIAATERGCIEVNQEAEFFAMLEAVAAYEMTHDGNLLLQSPAAEMVFTPMDKI